MDTLHLPNGSGPYQTMDLSTMEPNKRYRIFDLHDCLDAGYIEISEDYSLTIMGYDYNMCRELKGEYLDEDWSQQCETLEEAIGVVKAFDDLDASEGGCVILDW